MVEYGEGHALEEITEELGRPMNLDERSYLAKHELTWKVQTGGLTPQEAANEINSVFKSNRRKSILKSKGNAPAEEIRANKTWLNSALMAYKASTNKDVEDFRRDVLKDKLLKPERVSAWIKSTKRKDGKPTLWLDGIELPGEAKRIKKEGKLLFDKLLITEAVKVKGFPLKYWQPEDDTAGSVYVTREGVLDRLRLLSIELVSRNRNWTLEQSTTFILTGQMPWIEQIEISALIGDDSMANRLQLSIDPRATDAEVINAVRWGRKQFFINAEKRDPSEKNLMLAYFYATQWIYPAGKTLNRRERAIEWNKICDKLSGRYREYKYDPDTRLDNLQRDAKSAYDNYIVGREYKGSN